jgi:DNA-binding transcriptional MocR family regulator
MSKTKLAYARTAYKSFSQSARHLLLLIATHQSIETGWAYLSYLCLSDESGLTRRRVIQLVALLEARGVLEVRRGHGRGNVNFYRILREEDGQPVPHKREKKVKSQTPPPPEKVKFPTPPEPQKVKSEPGNTLESLTKVVAKVVDTKERKDKAEQPVSLSPAKAEDKDEWLTPAQAVKIGLTPGSRLYGQATGEVLPPEE